MQLEYIYENLNRIMQDPDSVLYLRQYDIGRKRALFAVVKESPGVYKKVQITKEQSKLTFPFDPIYWFSKGPGHNYLENFICFNWIALNVTNLDGFKDRILKNRLYNIGIFAIFNDGSAAYITREKEKKFKKQGGIEPYIDLLKQHKVYAPKYDTYEFIETHSVNEDTFIIPSLQEKISQKQRVKKQTKDPMKQD